MRSAQPSSTRIFNTTADIRPMLLAATSGMHYPESRFILRRVRVPSESDLLPPLRQAGYHVEPDVGLRHAGALAQSIRNWCCSEQQAERGVVPHRPRRGRACRRRRGPVGAALAGRLSPAPLGGQSGMKRACKHEPPIFVGAADVGQVSCTVTFDPAMEGPQLDKALNYFQYQLKGVSFLPRLAAGSYPQMPLQAIDGAPSPNACISDAPQRPSTPPCLRASSRCSSCRAPRSPTSSPRTTSATAPSAPCRSDVAASP